MSKAAIIGAFYDRLTSVAGGLSIATPNQKFDQPSPSTAYIVAQVAFAQPENGEQGRGRDREVGYLEAVLKFPLGQGEGPALARAETIAAAFPKATSLATTDGVNVMVDRPPEIRPGYRDGDRWSVPVRVRFFANL